jgi:hypothetical protein
VGKLSRARERLLASAGDLLWRDQLSLLTIALAEFAARKTG